MYFTCFTPRPYRSCTNCGIPHYSGAHAGPDLVNCGIGCSSQLLLHPSSTSTDSVQMFAPCACAVFFYKYILDPFPHVRKSVVWWYTYIGGGSSKMPGC